MCAGNTLLSVHVLIKEGCSHQILVSGGASVGVGVDLCVCVQINPLNAIINIHELPLMRLLINLLSWLLISKASRRLTYDRCVDFNFGG